MSRQRGGLNVVLREDRIRMIKQFVLSSYEQALRLADEHGVSDDDWLTRLAECADATRRELGLRVLGSAASTPSGVAPGPALRLVTD